MRRADGPVPAAPASKTRPRTELACANIRGHLLNDSLGLFELLVVACGHERLIVLQIMKHQAHRLEIKNLARRHPRIYPVDTPAGPIQIIALPWLRRSALMTRRSRR